MAHHLNPGRQSQRVPLSSAVPTTWRNKSGSAVTVRLIADVPFHVTRARDKVTEATVADMLVPDMSAISVTVEPGEHLSFLAYSWAGVDDKLPRFMFRGGNEYTIEPLPGVVDHREGDVWVQCDGFVWASEVR